MPFYPPESSALSRLGPARLSVSPRAVDNFRAVIARLFGRA